MKLQRKSFNLRFVWLSLIAMILPFGLWADTIPVESDTPLKWRIGAQLNGGHVFGTNAYLRGSNPMEKAVNGVFGGGVRVDFSFNPNSRKGLLYKELYQGLAVGASTYFSSGVLGSPVSAYVYQGMPFVYFGNKLSLNYEWEFGAAFGWKHAPVDSKLTNSPVSTAVTAHMGIAVKLYYSLTDRISLSAGVSARHFSNGNTSLPNAGVNSISAVLGLAYSFGPTKSAYSCPVALSQDADKGRWFYDLMGYGAWRKRLFRQDMDVTLIPGRFAVAGLQFAAMRALNRYVAVGPAIDLQYDESAALEDYYVPGTYGEDIKFYRPPFGKQLRAGISAHAELTMPIFAVNAGLGIDILSPKGEKRFYQSLAVKAFITDNIFLNVGYRLGNFKDPRI